MSAINKLCIFIFLILLSLSSVQAATVEGSIYDLSLNKVNNVKVSIDSTPAQTFISRYGYYSFELPNGEYTLMAEFYEDNILTKVAEESVIINQDGKFIIDLVLFPSLVEDEDDIEIPETNIGQESYIFYYLMFLFFIGLLYFRYKELRPKVKPVSKHTETYTEIQTKREGIILDPELKKVIDVLKENSGRATQKDIRQKYPSLSEAKISLMITELEHKGVIQKVKKGRGNIIWLKRQ